MEPRKGNRTGHTRGRSVGPPTTNLETVARARHPVRESRTPDNTNQFIRWNKTDGQATVTAAITDGTLAALPHILDPNQDGYPDIAGAAGPTSTRSKTRRSASYHF
jgi:hypothetical protein